MKKVGTIFLILTLALGGYLLGAHLSGEDARTAG